MRAQLYALWCVDVSLTAADFSRQAVCDGRASGLSLIYIDRDNIEHVLLSEVGPRPRQEPRAAAGLGGELNRPPPGGAQRVNVRGGLAGPPQHPDGIRRAAHGRDGAVRQRGVPPEC